MTWIHIPSQRFHYSQDTVGFRLVSDSPAWKSKPSATSSGTNTVSNSSSNASQRATWTRLPFGTTSQPSTDCHGVDTWILLLAVSRASRTVTPENVLDVKIRATSGLTPIVSYGKWSPDTFSWKMSEDWQTELTPSRRKSLGAFPRQGMTRNGVCTARPKPGRPTSGQGGGVWPTPTVQEAISGHGYQSSNGKDYPTLTGLVGAAPARGGKMWPTPKTPTGGGQMERKTPGGGIRKLEDVVSREEGRNTGQLNPNWVSWLMGLPIGWVSLEPLESAEILGWETEPDIPRVAAGVKDRVNQLKALGNGIVPAVVARFLHA